jgi:cytochrome c553
MMKKSVVLFLASILISGGVQADEVMQANIKEGKGVLKAYFGDLKGELQKGMKEKGPVPTISTCNTVAPSLSEAHSQMSGWSVGRTSLKVRNPDNRADAWETAVLKDFENRKAAGEDPMKIMKAEIVEENGRKIFRMMKAIPTAEVCTKCHGAELAEPVSAKLKELYPEDEARGYKPGDLRGAFTLKKAL